MKNCHWQHWLIVLWLLAGLVVSGAGLCRAGEHTETVLTHFNTPGIVKLGDTSNEYTVKVPIPDRWLVSEVTLQLSYINSTALMASRSRLVILCNDYPVAQVTLEPKAPEGLVTVSIPVRLLEPGYNNLTFEVAQNFTDEGCIPARPHEVWTTLKLDDSSLDISYDLREVPLSLAAVSDFLFDPRMHGKNTVHLVAGETDPATLELVTLTASGVALRFDYRPVHFSIGRELRPGVDNILLGSEKYVIDFLARYGIQADSSHLGISHLPVIKEGSKSTAAVDRQHGLLYLSGSDAGALRRSVEAFAVLSYPLPDVPSCMVQEVVIPEITRYSGRNVLAPGKVYTFKELNWYTTTFQGIRPKPGRIAFTLPSDMLQEENRAIEISLNLVYGAMMREDSVLSILLNDHFVASLPFDDKQGKQYRGYRIKLPLTYVKPGRNILSLKPVLTPLHTGDCELVQDEHLIATIFDDSTLTLPDLINWTDMPHLEYLFDDGFPLAAFPDFRETILLLPEQDDHSVAAMVNMVAMISQRVGIAPFRLRISASEETPKDKNLLVIGRRSSIPGTILDSSPLLPAIRMGFNGRLPGTLEQTSWRKKLLAYWSPEEILQDPVTPDVAAIATDPVIGAKRIVLSEFESPFTAMRSVVLVTAESLEDLADGVATLQDPTVREQCRQELTLIDFSGREPLIRSNLFTTSYHTGDGTVKNRLSYLVGKATSLFYIVLGLLFGLLALLLALLLKRRRRRKLAASRDIEDILSEQESRDV